VQLNWLSLLIVVSRVVIRVCAWHHATDTTMYAWAPAMRSLWWSTVYQWHRPHIEYVWMWLQIWMFDHHRCLRNLNVTQNIHIYIHFYLLFQWHDNLLDQIQLNRSRELITWIDFCLPSKQNNKSGSLIKTSTDMSTYYTQ